MASDDGSPIARLRRRARSARPLSYYRPGRKIVARDRMARLVGLPEQYTYTLTEPPGRNFAPGFRPRYTPAQMLAMGVFEGRYLNDCTGEFPREWFEGALRRDKLRPGGADPSVNEFGVKSRKSLQYWRAQGWIPHADAPTRGPGRDRDARGWFQWYCRYWLGRRVPELDAVQIRRWKSYGARHRGQIEASYRALPRGAAPATRADKRQHRARQRQGLLQWSHDCYA